MIIKNLPKKKDFFQNLLGTREIKFCTNLPKVFRRKSFFQLSNFRRNWNCKKNSKTVNYLTNLLWTSQMQFWQSCHFFRQFRKVLVPGPKKKSENRIFLLKRLPQSFPLNKRMQFWLTYCNFLVTIQKVYDEVQKQTL